MSVHILDILHSHHADRLRHRKLEHEIADYHTEAERRDLEATLERYSDEDAREIRQILVTLAA